jgi:hypothetical protein
MVQKSGLGCKHEKRATADRAFIMEFDCPPYRYTVELVVAVDGGVTLMTGQPGG